MNKKTERKNKTNLVVVWPTTPYFTNKELFALNAGAKEITLRVRLMTEKVECGQVAEIGCITGGQGRPQKVYAFTPVSQSVLDLAQENNITLVDQGRLQKLASLPSVSPVAAPPTVFVPKTTVAVS